jgi:hypothetical protein
MLRGVGCVFRFQPSDVAKLLQSVAKVLEGTDPRNPRLTGDIGKVTASA